LIRLGSQSKLAVHVMNDFGTQIAPKLPQRVRVLTTDAAFSHSPLRAATRRAGVVDNIQVNSNKDDPKTLADTEKAKRARIKITGFPNWNANGHRELLCRCVSGSTSKRNRAQHERQRLRAPGREVQEMWADHGDRR
jgi:hypothetical protein